MTTNLPPYDTISEMEIIREVFLSEQAIMDAALGGVHVGRTDEAHQQLGTILLLDAGWYAPEDYLPLSHPKIQARVVAPTTTQVDAIKSAIETQLHYAPSAHKRRVVRQPSNGLSFLVHGSRELMGTHARVDEQSRWWSCQITLAFTIGRIPIPAVEAG